MRAKLIKCGDVYHVRSGLWPFDLYLSDIPYHAYWWSNPQHCSFPTEEAAIAKWEWYKAYVAKQKRDAVCQKVRDLS